MGKKGQIGVNSENIFPVIKKWLYSDRDIFLRELVSNSCDAIKKLESLINLGEAKDENIKPRIDIILDKDKKTLSICDNGIGMTEDEVEKYITQIAFSGAEDFIEKYKDKTDINSGIIGHFGLGFYSAFMVSDLVEIETLSYKDNSHPVHWESNGSTEYEIDNGTREKHGSTIILHINEESSEFLDSYKIRDMLRKYCYFMPYEIFFKEIKNDSENSEKDSDSNSEEPVNNTHPLWLKVPKDCKDEEYISFYKETFFDMNDPLFWIHLNVDYPFNLKGILYFPKQTNKVEVTPGEIKLFSNQVYIADNIKEVVPEFLMLLKGVIDCPDLPLNVSRSFLQNDQDVAKISRHISKKVSDKLHSIFNSNREKYEKYWDNISPFIKFGCIKDEKFYDKVKDILLLKTIYNKYMTIDECPKYDNNKIFYVTDENIQAQYIRLFKENDMTAVLLTHMIDQHFITFIEYKNSNVKFARIDSDISSNIKSNSDENNDTKIIEIFKSSVDNKDVEVKLEHLKSSSTPAIMLISEQERRMQEMSELYGGMFGNIPNAKSTIVLNMENEVVKAIPNLSEENKKIVCMHIYDLALMSNKKLNSDEMNNFINRSVKVLQLLTQNDNH